GRGGGVRFRRDDEVRGRRRGRGRRVDPPVLRGRGRFRRQRERCDRRAGDRESPGVRTRLGGVERQREHPLEQGVQLVELLAGQVVRAGGGRPGGPSAP